MSVLDYEPLRMGMLPLPTDPTPIELDPPPGYQDNQWRMDKHPQPSPGKTLDMKQFFGPAHRVIDAGDQPPDDEIDESPADKPPTELESPPGKPGTPNPDFQDWRELPA